MGKMGNASPNSPHRRKEFDEAENDHHVFRRDREKEIDVNGSIGEEPAKREQDAIDRPGGSDDRIRRKENSKNSRTDTTKEEVEKEPSRPPIAFQFTPEHPKWKKVEKNVEEVSV